MSIYSKIESEKLICNTSDHKFIKDGQITGFSINDSKIAIEGCKVGGKIGIVEFDNKPNKRVSLYTLDKPTDTIDLSIGFTHEDPLNHEIEIRYVKATFSSFASKSEEESIAQNTLPSHQIQEK